MNRILRRSLHLAPIAFLLVLASTLGLIRWRALRALSRTSQQVAAEENIAFSARILPSAAEDGFEWISAPAVFSQAVVFQDRLYLCGPAGLYEYDRAGKLLKHYRAGRELPASPLLRAATAVLADSHTPELLLATASEGIVAFDGSRFRQIRPSDATARTISSILPLSNGHLLIGTRKRGLLVYDGRQIRSYHPGSANLQITELAGDESDIWIGTQNAGVLHWHAGQADRFSDSDGLPDKDVTAIAVDGDRAFVGTPVGVAEFERGSFRHVLARGVFARSLLLRSNSLLIGTIDEGVQEVSLAPARLPASRPTDSDQLGEIQQVFASGDKDAYALARQGLYLRQRDGFGWRKVLQPEGALLTDRNISALALDRAGRVWVGYFDRGLDLLSGGGDALHVENDHVFCVNRIVSDIQPGVTAIATANGLVLFDSSGHQQQVLRREDGLIADHVTDVVAYGNGMALATPAGLTFLDPDGAHSLYAFHGLVNNHVYALATAGESLMAGTLGGISELRRDEIVVNYTSATSGLKHNWISAVVPLGDGWMVGTYGAGIVRLTSAGRFEAFDIATAPFEVNPNAMLATERHVFAGTLGRGLYVYNRDSGRWNIITAGLPSLNVTALAASQGYLYVGTDNGLVRVPEQGLDR